MRRRSPADRLVDRYLAELHRALARLPKERRRQIADDVASHIAEGRAELDEEGPVAIEALLARVGDPRTIAADAGSTIGATPPVQRFDAYVPWLLLAGAFVFVVGWLAGVVLLWESPTWPRRDKLLGTLALPFGLAFSFALLGAPGAARSCVGSGAPGAPVTLHCTTSGFVLPFPIGLLVLAVSVVAPILTFLHLRRAARRRWEPSLLDGDRGAV